MHLGNLDLSPRERSLSGCLAESLVSGFAIHLRVSLTEEEGDTFMGAVGVDRMEDLPVVEIEGDMEVVDAEFVETCNNGDTLSILNCRRELSNYKQER